MINKRRNKLFFLSLCLLIVLSFALTNNIYAQEYWQALPPYNTLWPLWSPALSPFDSVTGIRTPIISSLERSTILPVEPGLTWDPSFEYPWLLYNTPVGLAHFDPLYGIDFWPPSHLLDSDGLALPLALPTGYSTLAPTNPAWLQQNVLPANVYFLQAYPSFLGTADPSLFATATPFALPPNLIAALELGLTIPTLGTTLFPPPDILDFLTPAVLLGY